MNQLPALAKQQTASCGDQPSLMGNEQESWIHRRHLPVVEDSNLLGALFGSLCIETRSSLCASTPQLHSSRMMGLLPDICEERSVTSCVDECYLTLHNLWVPPILTSNGQTRRCLFQFSMPPHLSCSSLTMAAASFKTFPFMMNCHRPEALALLFSPRYCWMSEHVQVSVFRLAPIDVRHSVLFFHYFFIIPSSFYAAFTSSCANRWTRTGRHNGGSSNILKQKKITVESQR